MDSQNTQTVQYKHVSAKEKYCFGIGAIGKDAICNLVGAFLMLYFTDTLYLSPAFVGVLFFVARIWDAINDPMMGMIVDNTRTKYGKFRIWITVGTLVNSVFFILLFHSFHLSGTALYVYVALQALRDFPYRPLAFTSSTISIRQPARKIPMRRQATPSLPLRS